MRALYNITSSKKEVPVGIFAIYLFQIMRAMAAEQSESFYNNSQ